MNAFHTLTGFAPGAAQICDMLRQQILRGMLRPGTRMSEVDVAARAGTSRQPVREAFIRLAAEGLADVRPQRGTYVTMISARAVLSARFVREAIEADVVALLASDPQPAAAIERVRAALQDQAKAAQDGDAHRFVDLDDAFHRALAELAGQAEVWTILEDLKSHMNRVRHITARQSDLRRLVDQHARIVDAIAAGQVEPATAAMRTHLRQLLADLPEITAAHPDYFTE
ncbi:GntR family transcriptional regulator [uncultured Paracoccus sp.]|uniref:GntR family transcriptional regulator n=1 Tax=uncultured Paracoccus sp. TaxID=189685 RepID=UPI0026128777|nr:GntR family transcriptional regulator [uncultured Paracoccus sp.]